MGLLSRKLILRSHRYWQLLFFALALAFLFVVLRGLAPVLTPIAAALLISYLLDPLVSWGERRLHLPRWAGTLILFLMALLVVATLVVFVLPLMIRELRAFAEAVPGYVRNAREAIVPWVAQTFNVEVPRTFTELTERFGADAKEMASGVVAPLRGVAGKVAKGTAGLLSTLGTLLLIPVFTFYFLPKFPAIVQGAGGLIPRRYYGWVCDTLEEIDRVLAAWIRGQLTVISVLAVLYSVGLSIVGIKMAVLIGCITALLAFIPYVGVSLGVVTSLLVCLLEYSGPGQLLGVVVVFVLVQGFEGLVLTPYLVGEKVGLGPVGVLLALMIGGNLFGFVGILLAVPTAAALAVVMKRGLAAYRDSSYYKKGEQAAPGPEPEPPLLDRSRDE